MSCLTDDLKAFEISEGEWKTLKKDRSRWFERVSQRAKVFYVCMEGQRARYCFHPDMVGRRKSPTATRFTMYLSK